MSNNRRLLKRDSNSKELNVGKKEESKPKEEQQEEEDFQPVRLTKRSFTISKLLNERHKIHYGDEDTDSQDDDATKTNSPNDSDGILHQKSGFVHLTHSHNIIPDVEPIITRQSHSLPSLFPISNSTLNAQNLQQPQQSSTTTLENQQQSKNSFPMDSSIENEEFENQLNSSFSKKLNIQKNNENNNNSTSSSLSLSNNNNNNNSVVSQQELSNSNNTSELTNSNEKSKNDSDNYTEEISEEEEDDDNNDDETTAADPNDEKIELRTSNKSKQSHQHNDQDDDHDKEISKTSTTTKKTKGHAKKSSDSDNYTEEVDDDDDDQSTTNTATNDDENSSNTTNSNRNSKMRNSNNTNNDENRSTSPQSSPSPHNHYHHHIHTTSHSSVLRNSNLRNSKLEELTGSTDSKLNTNSEMSPRSGRSLTDSSKSLRSSGARSSNINYRHYEEVPEIKCDDAETAMENPHVIQSYTEFRELFALEKLDERNDSSDSNPSSNPDSPATPHTSFSLDTSSRDWNEEFQVLLDKPTTTPEAMTERNAQMSKLAEDFMKTAKPIVEVIVRERHLPHSQKSIRPVDIGGIAGGSKYIVKNMFFKFARDTPDSMYGGQEFAMKASGHELKSLNQLIGCLVPKVHFPLMALVNYLGWRVIVMCLLPINRSTLVYGSADGAKTIINSSTTMNEIMEVIGTKLNLKRHLVKDVPIIGPADIEGHKGKDGRFYLCDSSRLFPPAYVYKRPQKCRGSIWFRLLRPEFVKGWSTPLSSDSFSVMGVQGREEHNSQVAEATRSLEQLNVPQFVLQFEKWFRENALTPEQQHSLNLKKHMHRAGINIRLIFLVLRNVTEAELKRLLVIEMIGRTCRALLGNIWRSLTSIQSIHHATLQFLSIIFADINSNKNANTFWTKVMPAEISRRFILATETVEFHRHKHYLLSLLSLPSSDPLFKRHLLQKLEHLSGLKVLYRGQPIITDAELRKSADPFGKLPWTAPDFSCQINATTKSIHVHPYSEKFGSTEEAIKFHTQELQGRLELLGKDHVQVANKRHDLGVLLLQQGKQSFREAEQQFLEVLHFKEKHYGERSIEVATYLDFLGELYTTYAIYSKASDFLTKAMQFKQEQEDEEANSATLAKTYSLLADLFRKQAQFQKAQELFEKAIQILSTVFGGEDPVVANTLSHLALLFRQQAKGGANKKSDPNLLRAEQLYLRALHIMENTYGPEHSLVAKVASNLAETLRLRGEYDQAQSLFERCLKVRNQQLGHDHIDTTTTMLNLAKVLQARKLYQDAENLLNKCISIRGKMFGNDHYSIGKVYEVMAQVKQDQHQSEQATQCYNKALEILKNSLGTEHPQYTETLAKFVKFQRSIEGGGHGGKSESIDLTSSTNSNSHTTDYQSNL